MFRFSVPLKVMTGYAITIVILVIAVWMVYGNTKTLGEITDTERELVQRRDLTDSLVYSLLEMSNKEREVCMGRTDSWDGFLRSADRVGNIAARLKRHVRSRRLVLKIDSLNTLIDLKRENTLQIARTVAGYSSDNFYKNKVDRLHEGHDSVVIHPKAVGLDNSRETVYEVVKTRKGFFSRLADVFRRQRSDTVSVRHSNVRSAGDSARHGINIADTVAGVLAEIKREESRINRTRRASLDRSEDRQQAVAMMITAKIEQLLKDIRTEEHLSMQQAFDHDYRARRAVMWKIVFLASISLLAALVLLALVERDVKREREYRDSLEEAKNETERIMAQRERLLLTITHDIKAPAASISGFIELLKEHVADKQGQTFLANIRGSATHLLALVTSLLDYHRLENGKLTIQASAFCPARLIHACTEAIRPRAAEKGIKVECVTTPETDTLRTGDAFRIRQVLDNVVGNALKYTDEGSIRVSARMENGRLFIDVADTGCGMTPEEQRKVFNAFTRLPSSQGTEGVGLGLSITKELLTLLGGSIKVESVKGRGTTFHITIPVGEAAETIPLPPAEMPSDTDKHIVSAQQVMILDDDALQLQLLREMLRKISGGHIAVQTYRHVADALARYEACRPDIFFIDVEMPEMGGMDVVRQIGPHPGTTLIAMTAHDESIRPQLLEAGFDTCLFKPFSADSLAALLPGADEEKAPADTPDASTPTDRFARLTAFADDDKEAKREILNSFAGELKSHIARLKEAGTTLDRPQIAAVAHKALPTLTLADARCLPMLRLMSPENIGKMPDSGLIRCCHEVTEEMETILRKLDSMKNEE